MASQSLSKQDVKKIKQSIRKINDWNITPTKHIDQMMSQRNFAIRDVINVLINGRLKNL